MGIGHYGTTPAPGTPAAEDHKTIAERLKEIEAERAKERQAATIEDAKPTPIGGQISDCLL